MVHNRKSRGLLSPVWPSQMTHCSLATNYTQTLLPNYTHTLLPAADERLPSPPHGFFAEVSPATAARSSHTRGPAAPRCCQARPRGAAEGREGSRGGRPRLPHTRPAPQGQAPTPRGGCGEPPGPPQRRPPPARGRVTSQGPEEPRGRQQHVAQHRADHSARPRHGLRRRPPARPR